MNGNYGWIIIGLIILSAYLYFGYTEELRAENEKFKADYERINSDHQQLKIDYENLNREYQKVKAEKEKIQEDVAKLLVEYYGKELIWDISGISKYKSMICGAKIYLTGKIPLIENIPC